MIDNRPVQLAARDRAALWLLTAALAGALAIHASAEMLFALPVNPVGEMLRPAVLAYMHPYFEQYWNMFAPTPIDSSITIEARTRGADGKPSAWIDVSRPLLTDLQKYPISRYATLKIAAMNLSVAAIDDAVLGKGTFTRAQTAAFANPRTRPLILESLVRFARFVGVGESADADAVQIALLHHQFPRFTHRDDADDPAKNNAMMIFPWIPLDVDATKGAP